MRWALHLSAVIVMAWPAIASAECTEIDFPMDKAALATIQVPKANFVKDGGGCPSSGPACQDKVYLVAGDTVVMGERQGAFVCVGYVTAKGRPLTEWLPAASLKPAQQQLPIDWNGDWVSGDWAELEVKSFGNMVKIHGDAIWGNKQAPNTGEIDAQASPVDGTVAFTIGDGKTLPYTTGGEYDCRARMSRLGPYLLVKDNGSCGGANVTFTGFYRRKS